MKELGVLLFLLVVFSSLVYADCNNGILDDDEEGVDCGGSCPSECEIIFECEDGVITHSSYLEDFYGPGNPFNYPILGGDPRWPPRCVFSSAPWEGEEPGEQVKLSDYIDSGIYDVYVMYSLCSDSNPLGVQVNGFDVVALRDRLGCFEGPHFLERKVGTYAFENSQDVDVLLTPLPGPCCYNWPHSAGWLDVDYIQFIKVAELCQDSDGDEVCDDNDQCPFDSANDADQDGFCLSNGDCNDDDKTIYEGAPELCDNKDNNCNGQIDETICGEDTDRDCDKINDCTADKCLGTKMPEGIPTEKLLPNSYAEIDNDLIFETVISGKKGAQFINSKYSLADTYGCSCEQILKCKPGQTNGEYKNGCSEGTMSIWIKQEGWASSCSYNYFLFFP